MSRLFQSIAHLFPNSSHEQVMEILLSLENILPPSVLNDPSQLFTAISNILESQERDLEAQKEQNNVVVQNQTPIYSIQITPEGATEITEGDMCNINVDNI